MEEVAQHVQSFKSAITAMISNRRWMPWATLVLVILNIPAVLHGNRLTELGMPGINDLVGTETAIAAVKDFAVPILTTMIMLTVIARASTALVRRYERRNGRWPENICERFELASGKLEALANGVSVPTYIIGQTFIITLLAANLFSPLEEVFTGLSLDLTSLLSALVCAPFLAYVLVFNVSYVVYRHRLTEARELAVRFEECPDDAASESKPHKVR